MDHTPKSTAALLAAAIEEVEALHRFFTQWFRGSMDAGSEGFSRLPETLDQAFELIYPSGEHLGRDELVAALKELYGSQARTEPPFAIRIENARARALGPGLVLVTYEEHQAWDGVENCRISSAILAEDAGAPGGFRWLHVHETWKGA